LAGVDLALVLCADASASVSYEEFGLIAGGMAAGLRDDQVVQGLVGGGRSGAVSVLVFSGRDAQDVAVDWHVVRTAAELSALADAVEAIPRLPRAGLTAIGDALHRAGTLLAALAVPAARTIVDVAADGRANDGVDPSAARDALVARGVTINGLCVLHEEPDLVESFTREVIGGPGAFAQPCPDYAGFAEAMRRKLRRELLVA
jgi:Ca-activated chloride channel homolog